MKANRLGACVLATAALVCSRLDAQQPRQPEQRRPQAGEKMQVQVYDVSDIVSLRPDYPYRGAILPTTLEGRPGAAGGGAGGLGGMPGGFGGGGLGGGMGGGLFQIADPGSAGGFGGGGFAGPAIVSSGGGMGVETAGPSVTIDDLINAIQVTIEAEWQDIDGVGGVIARLGTNLIIRQTPSVHEQIEDLLRALGTAGAGSSAVTIDAWWMLLGSDELAQLVPNGDENERKGRVDRAALKELAENSAAYRGRITCFSNQTVHIVSGNRRTVMTGAVPTVGMGTSAYQPILAYPNAGVLLQVRPSLLQDRRSAILSVTSTVTGWEDAGDPVRIGATFLPGEKEGVSVPGGTAETSIDRVNMPTHHLETALRVPVGEPVLVGGMTVPQGDAAEKSPQLYLVVEVTTDRP